MLNDTLMYIVLPAAAGFTLGAVLWFIGRRRQNPVIREYIAGIPIWQTVVVLIIQIGMLIWLPAQFLEAFGPTAGIGVSAMLGATLPTLLMRLRLQASGSE